MMNNNVLLSFLFIVQLLGIKYVHSNEDKDWDVLVFSQRWPKTACLQWLRESSKHSCLLPDYKDIWTVHGLWPTKSGTRGPWQCNNQTFNESVLSPIESELKEFWINVENDTAPTSLWQHEWQKHGTCATVLTQLNSELKYFKQGLEWIKMFNMKGILSKYDIFPRLSGYSVENFFNSVKNELNHNPIVQCIVDKDTKESLISEIQICFDKSLNVIDCDSVMHKFENVLKVGDILTDCSLKKKIFYLDEILPPSTKIPVFTSYKETATKSTFQDLLDSRNYWIGVYKTFKFLIWATI